MAILHNLIILKEDWEKIKDQYKTFEIIKEHPDGTLVIEAKCK